MIKKAHPGFIENLSYSEFGIAFLITGMIYSFAFSGADFRFLLSSQCIFVFLVLSTITTSYRHTKIDIKDFQLFLILAFILISNLIINYQNYQFSEKSIEFATMHVLGVLFFLFTAQWITINCKTEYILTVIALLLAPFLLYAIIVAVSGEYTTDRARPLNLSPSWWGEVTFGLILCSLAIKEYIIKLPIIIGSIILIIYVQSRGSLLASVVSVVMYFGLRGEILSLFNRKNILYFAGIFATLFLIITIFGGWEKLFNFIRSDILVLDAPKRGLDSNLSNRLGGWQVAYSVFNQNPIFGQGFDTLTEVHNGFLRWLGEGGILLFGFMIFLIISSLVKSWRYNNYWAFSSVTGILVYFMTYPRSLNLNLVGFLFLIALFPWESNRRQLE